MINKKRKGITCDREQGADEERMIFCLIIRPCVLYEPLYMRTVSVLSESSVRCSACRTGVNPDYDNEQHQLLRLAELCTSQEMENGSGTNKKLQAK